MTENLAARLRRFPYGMFASEGDTLLLVPYGRRSRAYRVRDAAQARRIARCVVGYLLVVFVCGLPVVWGYDLRRMALYTLCVGLISLALGPFLALAFGLPRHEGGPAARSTRQAWTPAWRR